MRFLFKLSLILLSAVLFSSCATIFGGSRYYAKVVVPNHPNASITYKNIQYGSGEAMINNYRSEANNFEVTIQEEGCQEETHQFSGRTFRGWAFTGSLVGWTSWYIPFGVIIDGMTGSWWKPDVIEKGIVKQDYDHYLYNIDYTGCPEVADTPKSTKADKLKEIKYLLDNGTLTEEEFKKEKQKILESEW